MPMRLVILYFLFQSTLCSAQENISFININVDAYAEPVSINAFTDDWQGQFKGGDTAFLQGRAELGLHQKNSDISMLWRYDYLLNFSEDSAQLYYDYAHDNLPSINKNHDLYIKARYSEAYGIRWLPFFNPTPMLKLGLGFNLLKGYKMTEGQLIGSTVFKQPNFDVKNIDQLNSTVDYYYDEPQLHEGELDWHPQNPSALGFSLDAVATWRIQPNLTVDATIYDVYGRLYWQDIPRTHYQLSCDCDQLNHSITGQLAVENRYTQRLNTHGSVVLSYLNNHWQSEVRTLANRQITLTQFAVGYQPSTWQTVMLWEPQTRALGIEINHQHLQLRWLADSLNTNQAHRLSLSLASQFAW